MPSSTAGRPASFHPGAPEMCGDGIDSNCDGRPDVACPADDDADGDGFQSLSLGGADCNDHNSRINPNQPERCGNAVDDDCDGVVDEGCSAPAAAAAEILHFVNPPKDGNCACDATGTRGGLGFVLLLALGLRRRR